MAANTAHPWVPMTGAKHPNVPAGVPAGHPAGVPAGHPAGVPAGHPGVPLQHGAPGMPPHTASPAVITLDDDRRRYETAESAARRAQDSFMKRISQAAGAPPGSHLSPHAGLAPGHTPPPAHGMRTTPKAAGAPHSNQAHLSPGLPKPHKADPGPPPPLTPLQASRPSPHHQAPPPQIPVSSHYGAVSGHGVAYKPYDFARRNLSPRSGTSPGVPVGHYSNPQQAYPTAYSAPPQSNRPKETASPQVLGMYAKSTTPTRPDSSPAAPNASATGNTVGPPPAHSGTGSSARIPSYLPPPPPALSYNAPSSVRQPLPAPTLSVNTSTPSNAPGGRLTPGGRPDMHPMVSGPHDEQPLDLGAPTKRKVSEIDEATPAKAVKLEPQENNGMLFKVSEPSVLVNSEASNITTVENMALKKEEPGPDIKTEPVTPMEATPAAPEPMRYVHKLKKAWIKAYTTDEPVAAVKKAPPTTAVASSAPGDYSAPSTPSNNRATPSPAPSNASDRSKHGTKKVNGHATPKMDESESSDSSSTHKAKSTKGRSAGSSIGRGGASARGNGRARAKASDNDLMSDSDDCSKDSDATTSSRRSTGGTANKSRRGRKPKRGGGGGGRGTPRGKDDDEREQVRESSGGRNGNGNPASKKEKENPFNNPPVNVLKKTGESFLQDSDCFKVAPKLAKCRECKWSQHNKNAGSSASIFCR